MKVLIVEDNPAMNKGMIGYLSSQDYSCESVMNYKAALDRIDLSSYDCVVLDIAPGGDTELLSDLTAEKRLDQVVVIATKEDADRIYHTAGRAINCLLRPFHLSDLSIHISSVIRRHEQANARIMKFREIAIDMDRVEVKVNGHLVPLTKTEYKFLLNFVINRNQVLTMDVIAKQIWGNNLEVIRNFSFIYVHINNLRKKLQDAGCMNYLHSSYGIGYRLC